MQYQISGHQIDVGAALSTHVEEELGSVVAKYAQRPTDANVVFSRSAHEYVCESTVHLSTGLTAQAMAPQDCWFWTTKSTPRRVVAHISARKSVSPVAR